MKIFLTLLATFVAVSAAQAHPGHHRPPYHGHPPHHGDEGYLALSATVLSLFFTTIHEERYNKELMIAAKDDAIDLLTNEHANKTIVLKAAIAELNKQQNLQSLTEDEKVEMIVLLGSAEKN